MIQQSLLALIFTLFTLPSHATDDRITFGPEFELTNKQIAQSTDLVAENFWAMRLAERVKAKCVQFGCELKQHRGKYDTTETRVVFPDGYWFNISIDPKCVEIQAKPQTLSELKAGASRLNEVLFASAAEIGLSVSPKRAGHFNIGLNSAFNSSADEFLKFFIDYAHHAELASGVLRENFRTAPPLAALSPEQHAALNKILADRKRGKVPTIKAVIERIIADVYTSNLADQSAEPPSHNQAINLDAAQSHEFPKKDRQLEIRAVRSQASAEEFILLAELFTARIQYLRTQKLPESFTAPTIHNATWREKIDAFRLYVSETGLEPERFLPLLPASAPWPRHCVDLFTKK